jgi:3-oxoacyl-[acyl-carrier protein] reductase
MNNLKQKTAFITGGAKGIGAAIVKGLANEGHNIIFTYSSSEEKAIKLTSELNNNGKTVKAIKMDVSDTHQSKSVIEKIGKEYGTIDILVNNAGVFLYKDFSALTLEDFDWIMDINFKGVYSTILFALPFLPNGGRIVTTGSNLSDFAFGKDMTLYTASKSALQGLTKGLARDLGEREITVNLIQPGPTNTDMNPADGEASDFIRSRMAIANYGETKDIASLVTFLTSDQAKFITGSIMTIDGGMNA